MLYEVITNQVRFMVEAQAAGSSGDPDPGCYLLDTSDVKHELFVPSASETGYKATGTFTVPVNGEVLHGSDVFDGHHSGHPVQQLLSGPADPDGGSLLYRRRA